MNEVHQAKSSLNRKLHKPPSHYFPVCKVFKPVGWAKQAWREAAAHEKGGRTGEKERGLLWQTPYARLGC
jgi:hypothetical protein